MINFSNQVPSVYTSASRDFQYLSWLINIVLNSVKHNVDTIYDLPNSKANPMLTELLALTLGFRIKRSYDKDQLAALVGILPSLLKYKGTKKAVIMAVRAMLRATGSTGDFDDTKHYKVLNGTLLEVTLPEDLIDVTLFLDLMPYILPAGMSCRVVRKTSRIDTYTTEINYSDVLKAAWVNDISLDTNTNRNTNVSELFEVGSELPNFANFRADGITINDGLVNNAIIPVLDPTKGAPLYPTTETTQRKAEDDT